MADPRRVLVTGATGFVGRALLPALAARGHHVVATSRRPQPNRIDADWRVCDVFDESSVARALEGIDVAYFLVHQVGTGTAIHAAEQRAATTFARRARAAGVERIVYLGATAPVRAPSPHLQSRLAVGEVLRAGAVPTLELRSAIIIGRGGASWTLTHDLATRLPRLALFPTWIDTKVSPVALDDVIVGLAAALDVPPRSDWFDLPGPRIMTGREILQQVAGLEHRPLRGITIPFVPPWLSAHVVRLWTELDPPTLRDLVPGFQQDILPASDRFWRMIGHDRLVDFDEAVRRACATPLLLGHRPAPLCAP